MRRRDDGCRPCGNLLGAQAADFRLAAADGRTYALKDLTGESGTVIVFICNHCPYVKAVIDRLVADARLLMDEGVGFAAICSNDAKSYPEDSFANMREFARAHDFPFPYLHDETQVVARAYGAVCTPDFFGYDRDLKLKYRGRLDEGRTSPPPPGARRELVEAMQAIAATGLPRPIKSPRSAARSSGRLAKADLREGRVEFRSMGSHSAHEWRRLHAAHCGRRSPHAAADGRREIMSPADRR
jgi:peroxiredoxin